jgi:hypothetical protein
MSLSTLDLEALPDRSVVATPAGTIAYLVVRIVGGVEVRYWLVPGHRGVFPSSVASTWGVALLRRGADEERDALAAVIDKVRAVAVKASATPRSNDPFCVGIDIADDLTSVLAAGLAAPEPKPQYEPPDFDALTQEQYDAIMDGRGGLAAPVGEAPCNYEVLADGGAYRCQRSRGHDGDHVTEFRRSWSWPGSPAVPVEPVGETPDETVCEHGKTDWHEVVVTPRYEHRICTGPAVPVEEQQCEDGCLRGEGHDGPCLDAADAADEQLRASDYDGWSGL